jgi:ABC-2 type transport system permease protein
MFAEFKHTLRRMSGAILGWGIGLAAYVVLMAAFYDSLTTMNSGVMELINRYPPELMAFFGDFVKINTPQGYLDTYFFLYMPLIIGIFSVAKGAGLLASDEEKGILDLSLAHPVSRSAMFWGRWLGLAAATAGMLAFTWAAWVGASLRTTLDLTWLQLLRPCLTLWAVLMFFSALALLFSMLLPSASNASMLAGALLAGNWLLRGLAQVNQNLQSAWKLTPLRYVQGGDAVDGLRWSWLGGMIGATLLLSALAWLLFQRRDIRVGGERSWSLPGILRWGRK